MLQRLRTALHNIRETMDQTARQEASMDAAEVARKFTFKQHISLRTNPETYLDPTGTTVLSHDEVEQEAFRVAQEVFTDSMRIMQERPTPGLGLTRD